MTNDQQGNIKKEEIERSANTIDVTTSLLYEIRNTKEMSLVHIPKVS
jgi:hypothetical protein